MRTLVLLLCFFLLTAPAVAQSTVRGAEHDSFGRMAFDWDQIPEWSASADGTQLTVTFGKALAADPKALVKALPKYLKSASLSPDRRTVTFALVRPVQLKSFATPTSTVVDMTPDGKAPATSAPTTSAPTTSAPPAPKAVDVQIRGGEHKGFNRLVFDWPKAVNYQVSTDKGKAVVTFDQPASFSTTALEAALPAGVELQDVRPAGKGMAVTLTLPANMQIKHFQAGNRVALDMLAPTKDAAPKPEPVKPEPPKPEPSSPEPPKAEPPKAEMAKAEPPKPEPAKPDIPAKPDVKAPPAPPAAVVAAPPPTTAAPTLSPSPVLGAIPAPVAPVTITLSFDKPTAAAAFRRAGWLWLVFDGKPPIDVKQVQQMAGNAATHVEMVPTVKGGTAVRLLTRPGINPTVRKDSKAGKDAQQWMFDLSEQPILAKTGLAIQRLFDFEERGRLVMPASDVPNAPVLIRDPEVGDTMQVMPLPTAGLGMRDETLVPGAQLLATAQGVALIPLGDGVRLDGTRAAVELSMPGGLHLSREIGPGGGGGGADGAEGLPPVETQIPQTGPLEIARWMRGGNDKFETEHQKLMQRLTAARPEDKNLLRQEVARHYLANGMAAEALGVLRAVAATDPSAVETANYRGIHGVANLQMGHDDDAIESLSHPTLAKDPLALLWLAAAKARQSGDYARNALPLRLAAEEIKGLPPRLRMTLGAIAVRATAAAGDAKAANRVIEAIHGPGLSRRDLGGISFLQGVAAEAGKQWDMAVQKYRDAEDSDSRPDRAYGGRARIELQLRRGQITPDEAIKQLEKLQFAWRAEDFEYQLLKRLGELLLTANRHGEALRHLKSLLTNYSDHPDIGSIQKMMTDTFERLYLNGGADSLSPITAIGLYDEFQELTPTGEKGDEMIRKLADRLAAVDLLDRASELLRHQVEFRLQGVEKARIGARLAILQMGDHKPGAAIETLDLSEVPNLPDDLFNQRRYLRVRALADVGRSAEALALILNDQSDTAKQLRAEIYWSQKKWPEAAISLEATIDRPEGNAPLPPATQRRLVDLATAMTLARDERGLIRLRRTYGARMATGPFREAFDLLTSEAERGIIDYRRIADKIKQAENFQSFMTDWRKRVQTEGLSSVN